jgi:hypothetical protein
LDARLPRRYHLRVMAEQLTDLQKIVLEVDALGLTVRDSIRQVSARVGFFVGQQRYQDELDKAREIVGADAEQANA